MTPCFANMRFSLILGRENPPLPIQHRAADTLSDSEGLLIFYRKGKKTKSLREREREDEADGDGQRDSIIGGGVGIIGFWLLVIGTWLQAFP